MILILSPAKTMKFSNSEWSLKSHPAFGHEAALLADELKLLSIADLSGLLKTNQNLSRLAHDRIQQWRWPHKNSESLQAILTYEGIAFQGLEAKTLSVDDLDFAQNHLRILSGLYGVLRPADVIQPYRLEMMTRFAPAGFKNLYDFWSSKPAKVIAKDLKAQKDTCLVNLASEEYSKMILPHLPAGVKVLNIAFKELRGSKYVVNTVQAKLARGLMSRFVIQNRISSLDDLEAFDLNKYHFDVALSNESVKTFIRG